MNTKQKRLRASCGLMDYDKMVIHQYFASEAEPDNVCEGGKIEKYFADGVILGPEIQIK